MSGSMCAVKDRVLAARVPFRHSQTWGVQTRSEMLLWLELPLSALRSLCKDLRACGQQLQSKASKGSTIPHRHKLAVLTHTNGSMHDDEFPLPLQDRGFNIRGDQRRWHLTAATVSSKPFTAAGTAPSRPPCDLQFHAFPRTLSLPLQRISGSPLRGADLLPGTWEVGISQHRDEQALCAFFSESQ